MLHSTLKLGLAACLALGGVAVAANASGDSANAGIACGVSTLTEGRMMTVEGVVQSPLALIGDYSFTLKSSGNGGSTNISQGGQFSAGADRPVSLGKAMINAGSTIHVDFTITSGGQKYDCSQQFAAHT